MGLAPHVAGGVDADSGAGGIIPPRPLPPPPPPPLRPPRLLCCAVPCEWYSGVDLRLPPPPIPPALLEDKEEAPLCVGEGPRWILYGRPLGEDMGGVTCG